MKNGFEVVLHLKNMLTVASSLHPSGVLPWKNGILAVEGPLVAHPRLGDRRED
jgi:hypothetical protein